MSDAPEDKSISDQVAADRAWMEEQRKKRQKGRSAILDAAEWPLPGAEDRPHDDEDDAGDPEDDVDAGGDSASDTPVRRYRGIRHQAINAEGLLYWTSLGPVPDDCPVTALGRDGKLFYFLTPEGQLVAYEDGKFGKAHITALFAKDLPWLVDHYPALSANGLLSGFKADFAQMALFAACANRGVFDAREKVRGLGCWKGEKGELIQHLGDIVLVDGQPTDPGMIDGFVYPGRPPVPRPMTDGIPAAKAVFEDLKTWAWSRGELDARLLLGWIGCAIMGAALDWRPMVFITGDAGSGKSSVQERLKKLLPGRLASTVDATPAALRQIVNQDAIGVSFDEIEADMNTDQGTMVMKLARVAASGGTTYRGGKDHAASEFTLRGCFAFSAIVPPSMRVQDMQRLTFLRLQPLPKGAKMPVISDSQLREMGQKLAGRVAAGWERWNRTLVAYEDGLARVGHNQRGAKQFGSLLAACDLMMHDDVPHPDVVDAMVEGLERDALYEYETADPTWLLVWRHILSAQPQVWQKDGFPTVAEKLRRWLSAERNGLGEDMAVVQKSLNRAGLAVVKDRKAGEVWLAIPPRHQQIQAMFANSDFRAHGGEGAWTGVFRNAPKWDPERRTGVYRSENVPQLGRIKCTLIRLSAEVELSGAMTPIFDPDPEAVALADAA